MNSEGEKNFYRYDVKEKTIQRYFENPTDTQNTAMAQQGSNEEISKLKQSDNIKTYVIVALVIIIIAMLVYIISKILLANRNPYSNKKDELADIDKKMSNSSLDLEETDAKLIVSDNLDNSDIEFEDIELLDIDDEESEKGDSTDEVKDEEPDEEDKEENSDKKDEDNEDIETIDL